MLTLQPSADPGAAAALERCRHHDAAAPPAFRFIPGGTPMTLCSHPSFSASAIPAVHPLNRNAPDGAGDWRRDAACRGLDPELFFPVGSTGFALLQVADAKAVCAGCPVRYACLDEAVQGRIEHGVWGGLGEHERRLLRQRRQPADAFSGAGVRLDQP